MTLENIIISAGALFAGMIIALVAFKRWPRRLKHEYFTKQWRELQAYCRDKETWPDALIAADKLLDRALKKRRFKGKTMGERLVAAQRKFADNDDVWFAHNLTKKIIEKNGQLPLKESDVKEALISFQYALKDLGALPDGQRKDV